MVLSEGLPRFFTQNLKYPRHSTSANPCNQRYRRIEMKRSLTIISLLPAVLLGLLPASAPAQNQLEPGEYFRDCDNCPWMVVVPAGSFRMGSPDSEDGRDSDEGPVHEVTIAKPFAVGVYEVTFYEWGKCVPSFCENQRPEDARRYRDMGWGEDDNAGRSTTAYGGEDIFGGWGRGKRPVINVSWDDTQEYVRWLSARTGKTYRLLSESEWEYVARAGTTGRYHWGNRISLRKANYGGRTDKTVLVGLYPPNSFGLYDVHGNVWEWVGDCWNDSYEGAPSDGSIWDEGDCDRSVVRGGSFGTSDARYIRSANRGWKPSWAGQYDIGFRVAREIGP